MRKCPECQFINLDSRETCLKCGTALVHMSEPLVNSSHFHGTNFFWTLSRHAARLKRTLGRIVSVPTPQFISYRFPFLAAFLSLVPGLGQTYNHQPKKILWFVPPFLLCIHYAIKHITTPYVGNLWIAGAFGVMMCSFSDALISAAEINGQTFTLRNRLAALTYPVFLLGAFSFACSFMAFLQWPVFTMFHVMSNDMAPALQAGDSICGEGITYLFRAPQPGDVVRYDPPPYKIEVSHGYKTDVTIVDPQNGWERVMALPGETLECRDGGYFVNGRKLSREYYPLVTNGGVFKNYKITCPPGKYIILISYLASDNGLINSLSGTPNGGKAWGFNAPGIAVSGWEDACCVPAKGANFARKTIFERASFIYAPSDRRRFFQPAGPRFEEDARNPAAPSKTQ